MRNFSIKYRIGFITSSLVIVWICLVARLAYIQVLNSDKYTELGKKQYYRNDVLPASRGDIIDRYGQKLATDIGYYEIAAEPPRIEDSWKTATILAQNLGKSRDDYLSLLKQDKKFIFIDRKVPAEQAERIAEKKLKGITTNSEFKRFYPYGDKTGQVIGFTDVDNVGIEGLELRFNKVLAGSPGKQIVATDAHGNRIVDFNYPIQKPVNGNSIITTLDLDCQIITAEELEQALKEYEARSGTVILMNPMTGEILAMISQPGFDSNSPQNAETSLRKNRCINDTFEPGSIFKLVTAAAALEKGIVQPYDKFDCENGEIKIGKRIFKADKKHSVLTFKDIIAYSDNIGTYKVAEKVGAQELYSYTQKFRFGVKTGIELGGETSGTVPVLSQWSNYSLPSIAVGQEVTVNALQILNAYAAIANGGILMKPFIVKAIVSPVGDVIEEFRPQKIHRVVSEATAKILTEFFEAVVEYGTATPAKIENGTIAGKTGTAQKVNPETKQYSKTDYVSTFVAYYPSRNPKIAGIVVIDSPKGQHYGGMVAAPVLKNIITRIAHIPANPLLVSNPPETVLGNKKKNLWQKFIGLFYSKKEGHLLTTNAYADGFARANTSIEKNGREKQKRDDVLVIPVQQKDEKNSLEIIGTDKPEQVNVPDVRGLTIRDAVKILMRGGFDFQVKGTGTVVEQIPQPGDQVSPGTLIRLNGK
jgi:cell division protein FtsI (penicillin-binding protein 3)